MRTCLALGAALLLVARAWALDGDVGLHDPSTIVRDGSRFYAYATGGGLPMSVSDDGWTWRRAGTVMQSLAGGRAGAEVMASLPTGPCLRSEAGATRPRALEGSSSDLRPDPQVLEGRARGLGRGRSTGRHSWAERVR